MSQLPNALNTSTGIVDQAINGEFDIATDIGSATRMSSNANQNVTSGAPPPNKKTAQATLSDSIVEQNNQAYDWRVSLSVPTQISDGEILSPLAGTDGKMIFPFNPTILFSHSANYSAVQPTHTNYIHYAYENSQVDNLTITGEYFQENEQDAKYWLACVHFLRTMTKMFYGGESELLGNPPLVSRLNGYGKHVLGNIPVVITNFTTDMPSDVDYIPCKVLNETNYVPVQSVLTVTCAPNYARRTHSKFSLKDFAAGTANSENQGFI